MVKAKVIRGVYVRGVPHGEGAIVELSHQEFNELKNSNFVVAHVEPQAEIAAVTPVPAVAPADDGSPKKGSR